MRKFILTTSFLLTIYFVGQAQTKNFIDQPYIEVSGSADTLVTPNQIFIKIVISERDSKNKISVEESENKMIAAFKELGINTESDLTTSDMLSSYRFYILKQKDIFKTKEYILKVSTAATASKVFVQLEDLGISNGSIDRVDHTDLESIKNICRTKAIINAKEKAIALTKPISQTVGNAIQITDNESNLVNQLQGRVPGLVITGYGTLKEAKRDDMPKIEFEKIKVSSTISAKFILK
jgi:uncharacterized protein YggE